MVSFADGNNPRAEVRLYTERGEFWAQIFDGRVTGRYPHPVAAIDAALELPVVHEGHCPAFMDDDMPEWELPCTCGARDA